MQRRGFLGYQKRGRLPHFVFLGFKILLVLALLIWGGVYISERPEFAIRDVLVVGVKTVSQEIVEGVASSLIKDKNVFLFFPLDSKFFYPEKKIISTIKNNFPRISTVEVYLKNNFLVLDLEEREPKYLLCDQPELVDTKNCWYVDSSGFVFDYAPSFSGHPFFEFYLEDEPKIKNGEYFLENSVFLNIVSFKNSVGELFKNDNRFGGSKLVDALIYKNGDVSFSVLDKNKSSWKIIFDLDDGTDATVVKDLFKNLQTAMLSSFFDTDLSGGGLIDYVDLRINDKVFYKFR